MSPPTDFIAFCEKVGGKPLTPQQRLLATTLAESARKHVVFAPTPRTGRRFISEMWANYVLGHKADLLITDTYDEHSAPPPKDANPRHLCLDCKIDTIDRTRPWDYYMVHNDLWQVAGVGTDMLCLGCFAQRLGRPLEASDFTPAPINRINPLVAALCRTAGTELTEVTVVL